MIHVRISLEYRSIPFEIEIEGTTQHSVMTALDSEHLGFLLDRVRKFIDEVLEAKKE